ncbi:hypothetical protein GJ496_001279 [Pomphorhynchus laevis]|nr:hypothetical protein GJ496_001279 [Pomphorhynchus laevis]
MEMQYLSVTRRQKRYAKEADPRPLILPKDKTKHRQNLWWRYCLSCCYKPTSNISYQGSFRGINRSETSDLDDHDEHSEQDDSQLTTSEDNTIQSDEIREFQTQRANKMWPVPTYKVDDLLKLEGKRSSKSGRTSTRRNNSND